MMYRFSTFLILARTWAFTRSLSGQLNVTVGEGYLGCTLLQYHACLITFHSDIVDDRSSLFRRKKRISEFRSETFLHEHNRRHKCGLLMALPFSKNFLHCFCRLHTALDTDWRRFPHRSRWSVFYGSFLVNGGIKAETKLAKQVAEGHVALSMQLVKLKAILLNSLKRRLHLHDRVKFHACLSRKAAQVLLEDLLERLL